MLLAAIHAQRDAAIALTRACARDGAIFDSTDHGNQVIKALRKSFRVSSFTPTDMLNTLGKMP
jgi:hypothetical protein